MSDATDCDWRRYEVSKLPDLFYSVRIEIVLARIDLFTLLSSTFTSDKEDDYNGYGQDRRR